MKQDKLLDKPKEEPIQNYNEMIEEKEYKKDEPQEGAGSKPQIETENKF